MRRQPRAREQDRGPPCISGEDQRGRDASNHLDHAGRDEIHGDGQRRPSHPEIEVARDGEVAGERRILKVSHTGRAHAGLGEPVIEPCGSTVAQIGADRLMNRAEYLKQHEDHANKRKRAGERFAALHGAHEHTHRDRERRRQNPSQEEGCPPSGGQATGRLRKNGEELPFFALGQSLKHHRILPQNRRGHRREDVRQPSHSSKLAGTN